MTIHLGSLTSLSVHPALPILLTNIGPLCSYEFRARISLKQMRASHRFGVYDYGEAVSAPNHRNSSLPRET